MLFAPAWLAAHGYLAVALLLFFAALGLPLPVAVTLLLAGAAAHSSILSLPVLLVVAILAQNFGATLLFVAGRRTGWWLLGRLCKLSPNPELCIFRSADFFYERGAYTLLFARFIPGLNSMAPPLAGSLNMRALRFWRLDIAGAALYCAPWVFVGYLLSPFLKRVLAALNYIGAAALWLLALLAVTYLITWTIVLLRNRRYRGVARVTAQQLRERMDNPSLDRPIVICDVRSHDYYDPGMVRIKNSIRIEPSRLLPQLEALRETLAPECDIYVYCSCLRDATSARIAHTLQQQGTSVYIIEGGLKVWTRDGHPTEPVPPEDLRHLPQFE